ncbi:hypothetical protein [Falsiroseomonas oryziterrae]|uniref:hypothetical protein n=1 Tax=Falsiroseomonas oryziterrae TaxID=2911368 RepID=UPI001F30E5F9|nr:hypothetical protein [Roseomonas sp. NPKOSM-4]
MKANFNSRRAYPPVAEPRYINDRGIILLYDEEGFPGYLRSATLLATIAEPPRFAGDPRHERLVTAFCRVFLHGLEQRDPTLFRSPLADPLSRAYRSLDLAEAERLVEQARLEINRRLGASHTLLPFIWEALQQIGIPVAHARPPGTALRNMERTLRHEADRLEQLAARLGAPVQRRFRMGLEQIQDKAFITDVLTPTQPVLHIVFAFDHVMQEVESTARSVLTPAQAEALAIDVRGPQLSGFAFERDPFFADYVAKLSAIYELALPHLRVQRPDADRVVRLRPRALVVPNATTDGGTVTLH